jgi:hypothetical protein
MVHNLGPTKKLVPALNPETSCPAEFKEEDGLSLEVDCGSCQGANDLSNKNCLSGIVHSISNGPRPDTIVLKKFIHKRYRGECVRLACTVASELSALKMAIASIDSPSDRRCRTCTASSRNVLGSAKRALLQDPFRYLLERSAVKDELFHELSASTCPKANACISEGLSISLLARV